MPYSAEGVYRHEVEVPASGDALRMAAFELAYNIESYLFDYNHPGNDNKAFLDWCLQHFLGTHASSGTLANKYHRWDPATASIDTRYNPVKGEGAVGAITPKSRYDGSVRYSGDAMDSDHIDTSADVQGEAELYANNEVTEPWQASKVNEGAVPVQPRKAGE